MAELFEMKDADELLEAEFLGTWRDRLAIDALARVVHRTILGRFIETGGPLNVEAIVAHVPEYRPAAVQEAIARLDEKDLILARDGQILLAYPFAGASTAFTVILPGGRERHAVSAIDALGVSAMLGEPVTIRSRCHHCGEPLEIHAAPDGPTDGREIMVGVRETGRYQAEGVHVVLPHAHLLPLARPPSGVAQRASRGSRGRGSIRRSIQDRANNFWRMAEGHFRIPTRGVRRLFWESALLTLSRASLLSVGQ